MDSYRKMLLANKAWVQEKLDLKPDFFRDSAKEQRPEYLWIGCSDSRVPAEEITGTQPGELFVHRNIANLVVSTDFNLLSVMQFAVDYLKVKHIIVCGHYGCGGVKAALSSDSYGILNQWLRNIKDLHRLHAQEFSLIRDEEKKLRRMVEVNVLEQVQNVAKVSFVQEAWRNDQRPTIHGWVYGLDTGLIKDLVMLPAGAKLDEIYTFTNPLPT